jgi:hypothetical protein
MATKSPQHLTISQTQKNDLFRSDFPSLIFFCSSYYAGKFPLMLAVSLHQGKQAIHCFY